MLSDPQNASGSLVNSHLESPLSISILQLEISGMYWRNCTKNDAEMSLEHRVHGDFLIRDSGMNNCLFTISIKCRKRVVHLRTIYSKGRFSIVGGYYGQEPTFCSFVAMIEHYIEKSKSGSMLVLSPSKHRKCHVQLLRPVRTVCPTLKHLCRTKINQLCESSGSPNIANDLPMDLRTYVKAYPFRI